MPHRSQQLVCHQVQPSHPKGQEINPRGSHLKASRPTPPPLPSSNVQLVLPAQGKQPFFCWKIHLKSHPLEISLFKNKEITQLLHRSVAKKRAQTSEHLGCSEYSWLYSPHMHRTYQIPIASYKTLLQHNLEIIFFSYPDSTDFNREHSDLPASSISFLHLLYSAASFHFRRYFLGLVASWDLN